MMSTSREAAIGATPLEASPTWGPMGRWQKALEAFSLPLPFSKRAARTLDRDRSCHPLAAEAARVTFASSNANLQAATAERPCPISSSPGRAVPRRPPQSAAALRRSPVDFQFDVACVLLTMRPPWLATIGRAASRCARTARAGARHLWPVALKRSHPFFPVILTAARAEGGSRKLAAPLATSSSIPGPELLHPCAVHFDVARRTLPGTDQGRDRRLPSVATLELSSEQLGCVLSGRETTFVFTPKHGSWLNLVESFFSKLSETFVISVRHGSARAHSELRHQLEASPALLKHGVDYVLHAILDFIVDGYLPIVDSIEEEVLETEQHALDAFLEREEIRRLFTVRRELIRFQRVLGPMHEVCNKLAHLALPALDPDVRPYFHDVLDHVRRGRPGSAACARFSHLCSRQAICSSSSGWASSPASSPLGRRSSRCRRRSQAFTG